MSVRQVSLRAALSDRCCGLPLLRPLPRCSLPAAIAAPPPPPPLLLLLL